MHFVRARYFEPVGPQASVNKKIKIKQALPDSRSPNTGGRVRGERHVGVRRCAHREGADS
jgi:hypothetical protein